MTKLYQATGTVTIKVEADNAAEARREALKLIDEVCRMLPTGVSLAIAEHHQSRDIAIDRI